MSSAAAPAPPPPPPPPPVAHASTSEPTPRTEFISKPPEVNAAQPISETSHPTELLVLHEHPELAEQAVELLDSQWPSSHRAVVACSCDALPMSLVLVCRSGRRVVGHAQLSHVVGDPESRMVYIASLVVDGRERGRGYGRRLMDSVHRFCVERLRKSVAYLVTTDRAGFYSHLGYRPCPPVTPLKFSAQERFAMLLSSGAPVRQVSPAVGCWLSKELLDP